MCANKMCRQPLNISKKEEATLFNQIAFKLENKDLIGRHISGLWNGYLIGKE
jgi:hypothetical protein